MNEHYPMSRDNFLIFTNLKYLLFWKNIPAKKFRKNINDVKIYTYDPLTNITNTIFWVPSVNITLNEKVQKLKNRAAQPAQSFNLPINNINTLHQPITNILALRG